MPFRIPDAIKKFDFKLSEDGLPLANILMLGGIRYIEVCPCCSCLHQLPVTHQGDTFEPRCLWREWGRPDYQSWLKRFPDAASHRRVSLVAAAEIQAPAVQLAPKPVEAPPIVAAPPDFARREAGIDRAQRATKSKQKRTRAKPSKIKKAA